MWRAAGRSYATWRFYHDARARWKLRVTRRQAPILIYQMGKVGSTSIERALSESPVDRPVVQLHHLSAEGLDRLERESRDEYKESGPRSQRPSDALMVLRSRSRVVRAHLLRHRWVERPRVITLVRDPIARAVSDYFQNLRFSNRELNAALRADPTAPAVLDRCRVEVNALVRGIEPFRWFDAELRRVFGVDVFAEPFDTAKGYSIAHSPACEVALLQYERLPGVFAPAMETFLGVECVDLPEHNVGADKYYAAAYSELASNLQLDDADVRRVYDSLRVRHFYDASMIESFESRWSRTA